MRRIRSFRVAFDNPVRNNRIPACTVPYACRPSSAYSAASDSVHPASSRSRYARRTTESVPVNSPAMSFSMLLQVPIRSENNCRSHRSDRTVCRIPIIQHRPNSIAIPTVFTARHRPRGFRPRRIRRRIDRRRAESRSCQKHVRAEASGSTVADADPRATLRARLQGP